MQVVERRRWVEQDFHRPAEYYAKELSLRDRVDSDGDCVK